MLAFRLMVAFAILGAVVGAVQGTMIYATNDWFGNADTIVIEGSDNIFTEDGMEVMRNTTDLSASDRLVHEYNTLGIMINAIYRIFYIQDILADTFAVYDPEDPTNNLFSPYASIFQIGIYSVYSMGIVQIWRQMNFNSGAY